MTSLTACERSSARRPCPAVVLAAGLVMGLAAAPSFALDQRVGQAWSCGGAEADTRLIYVIGKLESTSGLPGAAAGEGVMIAHLSIYPDPGGTGQNSIAHAPFQANLLTCRDQRYVGEGHAPITHFDDGYASWRQAFEDGRGGWFTIPVDQAYALAVDIRDRGEAEVRQ